MRGNVVETAETSVSPRAFPGAPSLALTFLFAGLGFALPLLLFSENHPLNGPVSPEILNLNFLVAWMGLAHFVFAYHGQFRTLCRGEGRSLFKFVAGLALCAGALLLARAALNSRIFDFLVWIYFMPHFIKAELHFARSFPSPVPTSWVLYWFPAVGFGFLTFALFGPKALSFNTAVLVGIAFLLVLAARFGDVQKQLAGQNAKYALLGFFFIGEALVWGTYSKYMTPQFRQGVYVFHIAVASFYHYFRSYGFAFRKALGTGALNAMLRMFVVTNIVVIGAGLLVMHKEVGWFYPIFDVRHFTFWVGLHLVASDLFTLMRRVNSKN